MSMLKIGIDLSTTNTGVCVLDQDNNLIHSTNIEFKKFNWDYDTICLNISKMEAMWAELNDIVRKRINNVEVAEVGIELSNFKDPQLTQKFALYCGSLITIMRPDITWMHIYVEDTKIFNSNGWQMKIGCTQHMERAQRKEQARHFAEEHCKEYDGNWTEDQCDSYCIAYFLQEIKSQQESINEKYEKLLKNKKIKTIEAKLKQLSAKVPNKKELLKNKQYLKLMTQLKELKCTSNK